MSEIVADECFFCKGSKTTHEMRRWSGTVDYLLRAAQQGCFRCDFVAKCFGCFENNLLTRRNWFDILDDLSGARVLLDGGIKPLFIVDIFSLHEENLAPFHDIPTKLLLPGKTSSDKTFETIAGWIKDCELNHPSCKPSSFTSQPSSHPPRRLLEVRGGQIVLREHLTDHPVYACLSHCWGDSETTTKTTVKNLDVYKIAVPWNDLAKTFQEAVDICRRLDIHFLWIDSLCIIQDCKADWEDQSPQMASIYENAFLTIAATASKNSSGGCYRMTDPVYLAKRVPGTDVYVRRCPPKFQMGPWTLHVEEWPLFYRAWIYQELKLSRRVLHFSAHEVIWVCREARKSESESKDVTLDKDVQRYGDGITTAVWYERSPKCDLQKLWHMTVEVYSTLQLTFSKDRLPALAALTQKMEELRGGKDCFLAGLWEKTLLSDLLWRTMLPPKTGRSYVPQAPTWSWTSITVAVMWEDSEITILHSVSVVNTHCIVKGPACMGDFLEASVTLHAPSFRAWTVDKSNITLESEQFRMSFFWRDYDFSIPGQFHIPLGTEILFIVIGIDKSHEAFLGLLLWKRKDNSCYERIGYGMIRPSGIYQGLSAMEMEAVMDHSEFCLLNMQHSDITIV